MTTLLAKAAVATRVEELNCEIWPNNWVSGHAQSTTIAAIKKIKMPATAAVVARNLPRLTSPTRRANRRSAIWRIASRQAAYPGSTTMEFRDQKLSSIQRNSGRQPNQPSARSAAISSADHTPMTNEAILLVTAISQEEI